MYIYTYTVAKPCTPRDRLFSSIHFNRVVSARQVLDGYIQC